MELTQITEAKNLMEKLERLNKQVDKCISALDAINREGDRKLASIDVDNFSSIPIFSAKTVDVRGLIISSLQYWQLEARIVENKLKAL